MSYHDTATYLPNKWLLPYIVCIDNQKLDHPIILKTVFTIHQIIVSGKQVISMWLPSHAGLACLAGNVSVDAAAKAPLHLAESQTPVPFSDFYPIMNTHIG